MTAETTSILVTLPYFCVNSGIFCQYLLCGNVIEVSFRSRVRRKARNFFEFRRQVFALLLHNTVKRCFPSKPGMHRCFRKGSVHVHNHMVLQVTKWTCVCDLLNTSPGKTNYENTPLTHFLSNGLIGIICFFMNSINWIDNVNWPAGGKGFLLFWALALGNSPWCRANTWNVSLETLFRGQFILSTQLMKPNYLNIILPHWHSTSKLL